jgi:hypothetical protein
MATATNVRLNIRVARPFGMHSTNSPCTLEHIVVLATSTPELHQTMLTEIQPLKADDATKPKTTIGLASVRWESLKEARSTPLAGGWYRLPPGRWPLVASLEGIRFKRRDLVNDDLVKYWLARSTQNSATIGGMLADGRRTLAVRYSSERMISPPGSSFTRFNLQSDLRLFRNPTVDEEDDHESTSREISKRAKSGDRTKLFGLSNFLSIAVKNFLNLIEIHSGLDSIVLGINRSAGVSSSPLCRGK